MRVTDLKAIQDIAISFLYQEVEETQFSPIVVIHPVFESGIAYSPRTRSMVNILEDKEGLSDILDYYSNRIIKAGDISNIYTLIRDSYKLTFFKFISNYLSAKDYAEYLADAWTISENPNQDVNVSLSQAERLFKKANKKYLMTAKEYKIYSDLPDTFTVYRGVAVRRNPKGMSWTRNKSTAAWFSSRFDTDEERGYIQSATAHKKDVLAYFNSRNEDEIVISTNSLIDIHIL